MSDGKIRLSAQIQHTKIQVSKTTRTPC